MGVYITNIEMPKSCFQCPLRLKINPEELRCFALQTVFEETFSGTIDGRYSKCPLVEVKAPHGRLIDAKAFETENAYFWGRDFINPKYEDTLADLVNAAPTVLEAEGEG